MREALITILQSNFDSLHRKLDAFFNSLKGNFYSAYVEYMNHDTYD